MDIKFVPETTSEGDVEAAKVVNEVLRVVMAQAPTVHDILARPMVYEAWLKKAQEAVNG